MTRLVKAMRRRTSRGGEEVATYVVLPQALRNMIPALIGRFVAIVMATSLLSILGVVEFFRAAIIVNNREIRSYEIYTFVALTYFLVCYVILCLGRWCERRLGTERLLTNESVS